MYVCLIFVYNKPATRSTLDFESYIYYNNNGNIRGIQTVPSHSGLPQKGEQILVAHAMRTLYLFMIADTNNWSQAESKGDIPKPRSGATIAAVGRKLYLFGGLSRETGWFDELYVYDTGNEDVITFLTL